MQPTLRQLKKEAHDIASIIWGKWKDPFVKKQKMYKFLQENTRTGHIATLTEGELIKLIKLFKKKFKIRWSKDYNKQQWWK
jgi:hypothetical protein